VAPEALSRKSWVAVALAVDLGQLLDERLFPLVLGGDCSTLLGNMLALRKRGRFGLAFLDGHLDFRHPGNSEAVGAAAGEDLALVTGRGAPELSDPDGLGPLVRDGDVVALGERESDPETSDVQETEITVLDLRAVRRMGVSAAAGHARVLWSHLRTEHPTPDRCHTVIRALPACNPRRVERG
jgi:arginase